MVEITTDGDKLLLDVQGLDKLWSLKSRLEIPLSSIRGVKADSEVARKPRGMRAPGTYIPGVITAGTFHQHGKRVFWDVHNADNAIVIDLADERYAQLVVEVADPTAAIKQIESAIP
jgi:hypothetical protein